jgi:beta-mannosidase
MIHRVIFIGLCFLFPAVIGMAQDFSLSGTDWRIREADASAVSPLPATDGAGWMPARVPGNIQSDLEAALRLKPLWYGAGDPKLYEVAKKDWWYRRVFDTPPGIEGKRARLVFDGVDYKCEVWLNGKKLGENAGMFRRFSFDVAEHLVPGGSNQLDVRVLRIPEEMIEWIEKSDGKMSGYQTPFFFVGGMIKSHEILRDLKSPTNFSYDWGVNIWTLGIWKDVRLEVGGPAVIEWLKIETPLENDFTRAKIQVAALVDSITPASGKLRLRVHGHGADITAETPFNIQAGDGRVTGEIAIEQPALWWPNGHGEQPLYHLEATLIDGDGRPMHTRMSRFGVREVSWKHTSTAAADFPQKYLAVINGRPIRMIGSNLIPPDLLFARAPDKIPNLFRHARDAGFTILRLWGGGVVFPEKVYSLADELGIMLSFEIPIANCDPPANPDFLASLDITIPNIIRQVWNHPSIIEYTGGNEMGYGGAGDFTTIERIRALFAKEDPSRVFRDTDPTNGGVHSPWFFDIDPANVPRVLPMYPTWNGVTDQQMRWGEFGSQTPANLEVWHREIPPSAQWPIDVENPILIRKNVTYAVFTPQLWLNKPTIEALFGPSPDLAHLIRAGQWMGAESLRYAVDALRRRGAAMGGMMTWDFNEPWPNGAGSFQIDYDGRPLLNHAFMRQAAAPLALSLRYDTCLFEAGKPIKATLFITNDSGQPASDLRWSWKARDRRGGVIDRGEGVVSVADLEVKQLAEISVTPDAKVGSGPVLIEVQLRDADLQIIGERLHVFGLAGVKAPLRGLLDHSITDTDDDVNLLAKIRQSSAGPENLAHVGNGAAPATAASERPEPNHKAVGLNDGKYGNVSSWIPAGPDAAFEIDLGRVVEVGRFKLGRDRTGEFRDRPFDDLKIEVSTDAADWKTVFAQDGITKLKDYRAGAVAEIAVPAVPARFLRVTVNPADPASGIFAGIDEFEVYAPDNSNHVAAGQIFFQGGQPELFRPIARTTLQSALGKHGIEGGEEVLEIEVSNTGTMTALFCEPQPVLSYRTDLWIAGRHVSIPPGESRTFTIRAPAAGPDELSLLQTGWRVQSWNSEDAIIAPAALAAVGIQDSMRREFGGYDKSSSDQDAKETKLDGRSPEAATLPGLFEPGDQLLWNFELPEAGGASSLRLHTSDQSVDGATFDVLVNGQSFVATFPPGYGLQKDDPAHLARPYSVIIPLPVGTFKAGTNSIRITNSDKGWITWDAIHLLTNP